MYLLTELQITGAKVLGKKAGALAATPEAINKDGILADVNIQSIADSGSTHEGRTSDHQGANLLHPVFPTFYYEYFHLYYDY
jgi:hypothetical protein